jgi:hypothetical protein
MIKVFYLSKTINNDILIWYSWNLVRSLSNDQHIFLKNICAIKEGYISKEEHFIVAPENYKPTEDLEAYINEYKIFDMMFLDFDIIKSTNNMTKKNPIPRLCCYYMTRKYAEIILNAYDKPFTYLPLLFYDTDAFKRHGKIGIFRKALFSNNSEDSHATLSYPTKPDPIHMSNLKLHQATLGQILENSDLITQTVLNNYHNKNPDPIHMSNLKLHQATLGQVLENSDLITQTVLNNYHNKNPFPICEYKESGEIKGCVPEKKINLKFVSCFDDSSTLKRLYTKNLNISRLNLVDNNDYDYVIVINKPPSLDSIDPSKTIVFQMEPELDINNWNENYNKWYMNSSAPQGKSNYCFFLTHDISYNNLEWHLDKNIDQLNLLVSSKFDNTISIILSSQYWLPGHKKRINFFKYFETSDLTKNIKIDFYGKDNKFNFKNYKGSLPNWNKDNALIPYKYTFNAESCDNANYFTEKIIDAILSETLIFYWGCPNISDYLDTRAFIILDLDKFEASTELIINSMINNEYENRLPFIKAEKQKIINKMQIIPRINGLINLDMTKIFVLIDLEHDSKKQQNKFIDNINNMGIYRFEFTEKKEIELYKWSVENHKNIIILHETTKLKNGFLDNMTFLLNQHEHENIILNAEVEISKGLIDIINLDINLHVLNSKLCYYLPVSKAIKFQNFGNIFDTISNSEKWKVSTKSVCE